MAAPVISWAPIGWAMIRKHRSSIRGNARMIIRNLYLVGSGTFPTVGTANPTLTLSALALRTAEGIIKEFKLHE